MKIRIISCVKREKRAKGLKYALADFVKDCDAIQAFICFNTIKLIWKEKKLLYLKE